MCGRFSFSIPKEKLGVRFPKMDWSSIDMESYNIAPTHSSYIIKEKGLSGKPEFMSWGIPLFDGKKTIMNARGETAFDKKIFRQGIQYNRCLIPADSYYEWKTVGKDKIPYRILPKDDTILVMAGIICRPAGSSEAGFLILTCPPNEEMSLIHRRMPVIFSDDERQERWLSDLSESEIKDMMTPLEDDTLHIYRISTRLNKVSNNFPELHLEIPEPPTLF